jgi:diguanylate cyclase (GGDEF)-like protein
MDNGGSLTERRRGWHFFEECETVAEQYVYQDDRAAFLATMDRKALEAALDRSKTVISTFRMITENGPVYATLRISRMEDDERYITIGVTDVDEHMKQHRAAERLREEQVAYARLSALTGDFLCIYVVDPETGNYREFSASAKYDAFVRAKNGSNFFSAIRTLAPRLNHPDDVNRFLSAFTRENIMTEIERRGIFTLSYRIVSEGSPLYVQLKAAMVEEKEGLRLIVGINDIDAQVRQEEAYVQSLAQAHMEAHIDPLTGVKNRHAYLQAEERLNSLLAEGRVQEFAIVTLDVNDLKKVNDNEGHQAGDQFLRDACKIICDTFDHSPVFRVGGDEFTVIAQGGDYARIDALIREMDEHNAQAMKSGGIVIACGMAKRGGEGSVAPVFVRADRRMYENKSDLKARREELQ